MIAIDSIKEIKKDGRPIVFHEETNKDGTKLLQRGSHHNYFIIHLKLENGDHYFNFIHYKKGNGAGGTERNISSIKALIDYLNENYLQGFSHDRVLQIP